MVPLIMGNPHTCMGAWTLNPKPYMYRYMDPLRIPWWTEVRFNVAKVSLDRGESQGLWQTARLSSQLLKHGVNIYIYIYIHINGWEISGYCHRTEPCQ